MHCPNCGHAFDWDARFAQLAVCEACKSAIVVDKEAAKVAGKMAVLTDTPGPLFLGATGRYGSRRFKVAGRVRYSYEQGFWDEWFLTEPDGGSMWVGEDEGELTLTTMHKRPMPEGFWQRAKPGARLSYGEHSYLVRERGNAVCEGGEGILPFVVLPGEQTPFAELVAPGGQFITVERDEDGDRIFKGKHLNPADLNLDMERPGAAWGDKAPAPGGTGGHLQADHERSEALNCFACGGTLDTKGATSGALECPYCSTMNDLGAPRLSCPSCGDAVGLAGGQDVGFVVCPTCHAEVDTSGAEPAVLGQGAEAAVGGGPGCFHVGQTCQLRGTRWVITGQLRLVTRDVWGEYFSDEYLLYNPKEGYRWLSEEGGHFNFIEELKDPPDTALPNFHKGKGSWNGRKWQNFETDTEQVAWVSGQLPYVARAGDRSGYVDWISPPFKLTEERSEREVDYFQAEYIPRKEIAEAFQVDEDDLPYKDGVGANEPFKTSSFMEAFVPQAGLFGAINLVLFLWAQFVSGSPSGTLQLQPEDYKDEYLTEPVKLSGHIVQAEFFAPLDNDWVYLDIAVINELGEVVQEFSAQWEYYHGYEGGESWSEGNKSTTEVFKIRDPGEYRLLVKGEVNRPVPVTVAFRNGVFLSRYFLILGIAFLGIAILQGMRKSAFEKQRWGEEDDDDD